MRGPQLGVASALAHPHRPQHLDRCARRRLLDAAGAVDQEHERRAAAVQHRHFRAVELDDRVVDAARRQRRHHVLDGADAALRLIGEGQHGAKPGVAHPVEPRRDLDAEIGAAEHDARSRRRRTQGQRDRLAVMQPDPAAADRVAQVDWQPLSSRIRAGAAIRLRRLDPEARGHAVHPVDPQGTSRQTGAASIDLRRGRQQVPVKDYCRLFRSNRL